MHDTGFRYVLQPGETISASHSMPIGQVMFVPREDITFRDGTEEEIAARNQSSQAFFDEKVRTKVKTPYGMEYSPHYQHASRQKKTAEPRGGNRERTQAIVGTGSSLLPGSQLRQSAIEM